MPLEDLIQSIRSSPKPPTDLAIEATDIILSAAGEGFFPWPDIAVHPNSGIDLTWATMSSELEFHIAPDGKVLYEFQRRVIKPLGCLNNIHRQSEDGEVSDLATGTVNLLVYLVGDEAAVFHSLELVGD
jgi:hypothetical protein